VESLFTNGKSHLLTNEIDGIVYHRSSDNDSTRLQQLLREQQNKAQPTLYVFDRSKMYSSGSIPYLPVIWVVYVAGRYFVRSSG